MPCLIQIGQIGDLLITIVMGNQYEVDHLNKPNSPNYTSKFKDSHRMQCIYMFCMKASLNVSKFQESTMHEIVSTGEHGSFTWYL